MVAGDDPVPLQPADALGAWGCGEADLGGEVGHRDAAVLLQDFKDLPVYSIEDSHGGLSSCGCCSVVVVTTRTGTR